MDHGFQHVLRAWAEKHEACMKLGNVISSELIVRTKAESEKADRIAAELLAQENAETAAAKSKKEAKAEKQRRRKSAQEAERKRKELEEEEARAAEAKRKEEEARAGEAKRKAAQEAKRRQASEETQDACPADSQGRQPPRPQEAEGEARIDATGDQSKKGRKKSARKTKDSSRLRGNEGDERGEKGEGEGAGSIAEVPPTSSVGAGLDPAEHTAGDGLRASKQAEQTFLSRFNVSLFSAAVSDVASSPVTAAASAAESVRVSEAAAGASKAGASAAAAPAANALAAKGGSVARFKYADLLAATGNFEKQLGAGGSGSVFRGTLHLSATQIAVKKLEFAAGSDVQGALAHMQTEVQVLSNK